MKKILFSVFALAALASCVKEQTLDVASPAAIEFAGTYVENATKTNDPSTTTANITEFSVWGVMDNETGVVLDDELVTLTNGVWTYKNTQYWTPQHTYYFSALAGDRSNNQIVIDLASADDQGMSVDGLGTMTFTNVEGVNDVLYAEANDIETEDVVNTKPEAVKFQFNHLLSKVKFSFTNGFVNDNNTIVVKNIKMVVPKQGTIDLTQTDNGYVWTGLQGETTLVMGDMDAAARVAIRETASSDNERLTIPAAATQEYEVTFDVELWMGDVMASNASKTVKINGCVLEPGKSYNFKATINQDNVDENPLFPIEFEVEVDEWVEEEYDGGVIATNAVSNVTELQEAVNNGGLVTVAQDIVLDQPLNIPATADVEVKSTVAVPNAVTIDLNGKTISYSSDAAAHHAMINVAKGSTLIIKDSSEGGKISFEYTGVGDPNMGWGSYAIVNNGNLIVESGKVEILCDINPTDGSTTGVKHMYSVIDQADGSTTINGGTISNPSYRSIRIRKGSLTVNGGVMEGQVWMQPSAENTEITINGGEFAPRGVDGSSVYVENSSKKVLLNVTAGTFATKIGASDFTKEGVKGTVKGGTFGTINENLVAEGYFANLIDGKFVVSDVLYATNAEDMAEALQYNKEEITVILAKDIELPISSLGQMTGGSGEYKLGGEDTKKITIDLNNYKLNITTTYWSNLGAKNDDAIFTIKNGTMTSSQATGTWNSYDLCFSNCNYVLENVVFEKAIALGSANKSFTLNNVTINETHDYYAMWIEAVGQTVTIDGLTVKSAGRGIKIDEQYVDAPTKVTLNIANSTFETVKKAAILVKSVAGAEINVSDIDITKVAEDNDFAVWVDEDAAAYADKVVVNGAFIKVEGDESAAVASSATEISAAITAGATSIFLTEGEYVVPTSAKGKIVTFIGTGNPEDVKVGVTKVGTGGENCDYGLDGSNATFENITITTNSSTYIGYARCNGTYKNCIINGTYTLYGDSVFEDCTFNVSGDVYNLWTWGAPTATFKNCTFNSDGKALLLYGQANTKLTVEGCTFNDNGGLTDLKAAIEIGNDYNKSYELIVNDTVVNGYEINDKGINTGTTLWANKNSMPQDKLNVVVDGVDVY